MLEYRPDNKPKVSVVLGTYNCEEYIQETLESIFNQTFQNYEVVVVDDASTDSTVDILKSYGDRIRVIYRTENSGVCGVTKNEGMQASHGEYIAFQDADDLWYPEKLEKQVGFLDSHPDIPLCHTYCNIIDQDSTVLHIRHENVLPGTGMVFEPLMRHCFITICAVMIRRSLYEEIGGFATDPIFGPASEDHQFFLRVARKFPIGLVPEVLAGYRTGVAGSMASIKGWKSMPEVFPFQQLLLSHRELWDGCVSYDVVLNSYLWVCEENARYWCEHKYPGRTWFFLKAMLRKKRNGYVLRAIRAVLWRLLVVHINGVKRVANE